LFANLIALARSEHKRFQYKERENTMKRVHAALLGLTVIALAGCGSTGTPGGPGVTNPSAKKPLVGQGEETFSLSVPSLSTGIKQGETKAVSISIKRGKNFDEDVALKLSDVPKGLSIEPFSPVIKHGDAEANLTLKCADDAALGDFTIKVTGNPTKGAEASNNFTVTIHKK
jgi:hypothetical protein